MNILFAVCHLGGGVTWELGGSEYRLLLRSDVVRCDGTLQTAAKQSDKIGTLVHARARAAYLWDLR